jgi:hypothetical protein
METISSDVELNILKEHITTIDNITIQFGAIYQFTLDTEQEWELYKVELETITKITTTICHKKVMTTDCEEVEEFISVYGNMGVDWFEILQGGLDDYVKTVSINDLIMVKSHIFPSC